MKKNIVILGAGFAGITAALRLEQQFKHNGDVSITLIDKRDFHLFASNLYEIATAEEEFTTTKQLKKSITVPIQEILGNKKIKFIIGEILEINSADQTVLVSTTKIPYDYLVVALGSITDYFGIEGAEKFALPLKTLTDALRIRNQIEFALERQSMEMTKKNIRIVIAGAGYTGCEFAAELADMLEIVAWKYQYPPEKIEVVLVEAMSQVIPGLNPRLSQDALWRLKQLGVIVHLSSPIFKISEHFVELVTQEKMEYDVLVWTTGVRAGKIPSKEKWELDKKGRIMVNGLFQSVQHDNIFAIGDSACVTNAQGRPAPPTAQDAIAQGKFLATVLPQIINNIKPQNYPGSKHGFIVSLGGKWAIMDYNGFYFTGFFAYVVHELADLRYYISIVGFWKAVKYLWLQVEIYSRND